MHIPIMKDEVVDILNVRAGGFYIDCTLGAGGHSRAMLEKNAVVLGIDRDIEAIENHNIDSSNFFAKHSSFSEIESIWQEMAAPMKVDGIFFDLGFSSTQVDSQTRGFAFMLDAPLDMRYDQTSGISAKDWINNAHLEEMVEIFFLYGQEKNSRKIAKEIIKKRNERVIETTYDLVRIIENYNVFEGKHAATRIFQAIRIHVNDEFEHIKKGIQGAQNILKSGGVIACLTFHSLEDRVVKELFADSVNFLQVPCDDEIKSNRRSRSAKLRWMVKDENI